jgi:SAM-dependent methyltransferase
MQQAVQGARTTVDQDKLHQFIHHFVEDLGAALSAPLVLLGDELGLYKAMDRAKRPLTPAEIAAATATDERYVREWCAAQAASGYITYVGENKFTLTPEQAFTLADENSPAYLPGGFALAAAGFKDMHKVAEAFRSGSGVGWHEHHMCLFDGCERFFRPNYSGNLISSWLPSLEGVVEKLKEGTTVADIGCGYGASTVLMAQAFPNSKFFGFDYHQVSIDKARDRAEKAGVGDRILFHTATAKDFPGGGYGLVTVFDCLHDMGDPVGGARHVREALAPDGTFMIVEPFSNDTIEENLNPVGRVYYSASTMICTPASRSQEVGLALGAQAGEKRLREVATQAGFRRFRRAAQTPFNMIFEAKP